MSKKPKKDKDKKDKKKEMSLEEAKTQIENLQDSLLRSKAELENFRKRSQRDIQDARAQSKMGAILEILPMVDTFQMAMMVANSDNADLNMLLQGLNMIQNQFNQTFTLMGVDEVNAVGEKFDPQVHEAVSEKYSDDEAEGIIIAQHRCGYTLQDKLLRPASVIVSKGPEPEEEENSEAAAEESKNQETERAEEK